MIQWIGLTVTVLKQAWTLGRMILGYVRDRNKTRPNPAKPVPKMPPEDLQKLRLKIEKASFKDPDLKEIYVRAAHEGVRLVNTPEFKDAILRADFTETNGDTNEEIYKRIIGGADKANEVDWTLNVWVTSYTGKSSTLGYTYSSTYRTWVNRRYLRDLDPSDSDDVRHAAGHIIHEYCHNLGYSHRRSKKTSVPYVVGRIIRRLDV